MDDSQEVAIGFEIMCRSKRCAVMPGVFNSSRKRAIAAWNRRATASTGTEGAGVKLAGHRNITTDTIEELRSKWRQNPAMPAYQRLVFDGICDLALLSLNPPAPKVTTDEAEERG